MKNERKMRIFLKNEYYSVDFINNELKKLIKNKITHLKQLITNSRKVVL